MNESKYPSVLGSKVSEIFLLFRLDKTFDKYFLEDISTFAVENLVDESSGNFFCDICTTIDYRSRPIKLLYRTLRL